MSRLCDFIISLCWNKSKLPNRSLCFLIFYIELYVVERFRPRWHVRHMLAFDVWLKQDSNGFYEIEKEMKNIWKCVIQIKHKMHNICSIKVYQLTSILPSKSFGMVPPTQVPFILLSMLSSNWNTHRCFLCRTYNTTQDIRMSHTFTKLMSMETVTCVVT